VELIIEDDGRGFVVPPHLSQLVAANHFGLVGLRERVELLDGTLTIQTAPEQGCRIEVSLPLMGSTGSPCKEQYGDTSIDSR
jgi:two-component system sensor histidine kinase DegS